MTFPIDGCAGRRRVAAAVAGISLAFAAAAAAGPAPNQWSRKVSVCLRDACILTAAIDSDGDGVADVDEVAAGTDPYDSRSRPGGRLLLEMARARKLPSYAKGFTTIVVLPTTAPDGSALFGGEFALPGRKTTLEKLGITSELLKGIDLTKGVSVEVGDRGLVLSSLGFARLSKGDSPSQTISGRLSGLFGLSTSSSSTTSTNADGEQDTHSSTVTETCNSKNECSTTVTDSGGGTGCTDADCEGESDTAYRDPDYIEVTPSAEAVATALIVLNSRLDYYHDPSNDTSEPITAPPPDPKDVSPYILVTGDYEEPAIMDADFFYQGGVQPDYDPTLEMPLYEEPKDPDECWECRNS